MNKPVYIGTRGSKLALWQAEWVKKSLEKIYPEAAFLLKIIKTTGDKIIDVPLAKIGEKGLFTKELDSALLSREISFAVHSLKDLPGFLAPELTIGCVTKRWDVRDCLISGNPIPLEKLPKGAVIATGSLRRKSQLLHYRPDFNITAIRGNIDTRLRKLEASQWDGMILATAGVERLGLQHLISEKISTDIMLPAVGQGSLAIICRESDYSALKMLKPLNDTNAFVASQAERAMLKTLEGGCQIPIGALAVVDELAVTLSGSVGSLDGKEYLRETMQAGISGAEKLGVLLAERLLALGGKAILASIRKSENGV